MMDLFYMGGPLFMGILSLILLVVVGLMLVFGGSMLKGKLLPDAQINLVKSVGLFALIVGLLGQLIGLFSAFQAIELGAVNVSPALLAGGFKVSMITTIYGVLIYVFSFIGWFGLNWFSTRKLA